ncbi:MAG: TonB family protein [Myxococcales bacterium]|nr:TonB family protein [Myxococcales bacterium]
MNRLLRHLGALAVMLAGTALVLGLMAWMNRYTQPPKKEAAPAATAIDLAPPPKPKAERRTPPKPRPRPQQSARPRTPPPNLGSSLSAVSLGPPVALGGDLAGAGDALLGEAGGRDLVMTSDTVDEPPRPTRQVAPTYPPAARKRGVTGYVKFALTIGADGRIEDARVLAADPPGVFEEAARAAIERWSFSPGTYQGRPQTVSGVEQTIRFALTRGG